MSDKIKIQSVIIHWTEGPTVLVDRLQERVFDEVISANRALCELHSQAPERGYFKVEFTIRWVDGNTFTGRYDMERGCELPNLGAHAARTATYYSGDAKPAHLTAEQYRAVINRRSNDPQSWAEMAKRYDPGVPA